MTTLPLNLAITEASSFNSAQKDQLRTTVLYEFLKKFQKKRLAGLLPQVGTSRGVLEVAESQILDVSDAISKAIETNKIKAHVNVTVQSSKLDHQPHVALNIDLATDTFFTINCNMQYSQRTEIALTIAQEKLAEIYTPEILRSFSVVSFNLEMAYPL